MSRFSHDPPATRRAGRTTSRRQFLRTLGLATGTLIAPGGAIEGLCARLAAGSSLGAPGYGALESDPGGLLDLPAGFQYRAFSAAWLGEGRAPRFDDRLTDGDPVPALHDGMGAFPTRDGGTLLVRNHELTPGDRPAVAPGAAPRYDPLGTGGTTTLWVDRERRLVRSHASLAGTFRNCGGGATPWGTWLTAEECTYTPGPPDPARYDQRPDVARRHGYVFEVRARAGGLAEAIPIVAMGRFYHEAVAVDPSTGFLYLTEDRSDGLLYRYRPRLIVEGRKRPDALAAGDLARGGILEALRIVDHPAARTQNWSTAEERIEPGRSFAVEWTRIPEVDPDVDMERDPTDPERDPLRRRARTAATSTRGQGLALGAAQFARVEGITLHRGAIYFCATNGGRAHAGQVWRLAPAEGRLTLVLEPDDPQLLDGPDNLSPSPHGDLVACEDGAGENFVLGITPQGTLYRIARNAHGPSEFAGACWSADGSTLFVNTQNPGITFAIWGPWHARKA